MKRMLVGRGPEAGMSLLEIIVVLAVMTVLFGMAVPTLIGAESTAKSINSQNNLNSVLSAGRQLYGQTDLFLTTIVTQLKTATVNVTYKGASTALGTIYEGKNVISVKRVSSTIMIYADRDGAGYCWAISDNETATKATTITGGVTYFWATKARTCDATLFPKKAATIKSSTTTFAAIGKQNY